jgi:protein phosphatase
MRFGGTREELLAEVSHVGDSRVYLLRGGELKPITEDHSLVAELVRSGDLTRAQASEHPQKNLITRALGAEDEVEVDTMVLPVEPGDRLMLCSDGLSDMVPEARMLDLLTSPGAESPEKASRTLVRAALDAGGADNVTVVVVDVKEEDSLAGQPRRGDTQELPVVTPEEASDARQRPVDRDKRAKSRGLSKAPGMFVRALAGALALAALVMPFYLWGQSRYFLGFEEGEVVIYRGLPYTPLNVELYKEVRRTDLKESEIDDRYRDHIENHNLYSSEEQVEAAVRDLEAEEPTQR